MEINVDLSFFPENLAPLIINSKEIKSFFLKNYRNSNHNSSNSKISIFEFPGSLDEFEDILKTILEDNSLNQYVVVQDTETENTIAILKGGDMEQLGILICDFCGAAFSSEDEKYLHQRAHFLF